MSHGNRRTLIEMNYYSDLLAYNNFSSHCIPVLCLMTLRPLRGRKVIKHSTGIQWLEKLLYANKPPCKILTLDLCTGQILNVGRYMDAIYFHSFAAFASSAAVRGVGTKTQHWCTVYTMYIIKFCAQVLPVHKKNNYAVTVDITGNHRLHKIILHTVCTVLWSIVYSTLFTHHITAEVTTEGLLGSLGCPMGYAADRLFDVWSSSSVSTNLGIDHVKVWYFFRVLSGDVGKFYFLIRAL